MIDIKLLRLAPHVEGLVTSAIRCCQEEFEKLGRVAPIVLFVKNGKLGMMPLTVRPATKDFISIIIQSLRKDCDAVLFAYEAWVSSVKADTKDIEAVKEKVRKMSKNGPSPSQDPNREEEVLTSLYIGERTIMLGATIHRNPTKLGEFRLVIDSKVGDLVSGRFG
jgi:hypothetical protein